MKHSLLLAGDDLSDRESLHKFLHAQGYHVILAANGLEALTKFRSEHTRVDLLLVDLNMPLKNGWPTLNRLMEENPRLPIMVLTGLPNQYTLAEAAGVSALVEKPIDLQALLQLMQVLLAEPVQLHVPGIGRWEFPFHYLHAADQAARDLWPERRATPYTSGGLND